MGILSRLLGFFRGRRERQGQLRLAADCHDPYVAAEAVRAFSRYPGHRELELDTRQGKALFRDSDLPRLLSLTKGGGYGDGERVGGEPVFARAMMGGSAYGFPGGWTQDRIEQVMHLKGWVYIAIRAIWQRLARIPPNVAFVHEGPPARPVQKGADALARWYYQKSLHTIKPHETIVPAPAQHPLCRLFANPNGPDVSFDFWFELGMYLELTGNSYIWTVPSNLGVLDHTYKAAELWVLPAHWVWPRIGRDRLIEYYEIRPWIGPGMLRFPPSDVIHLRYKSPIHKIDGYSPQTAGAEWIDTAESINRSRFFSFKNGAFPIGNLKMGPTYTDFDDEKLERMYAKLDARFRGESNHGRPIITPPDAEYVPLTINPTEMAYTESADQLRDWILALWGVPKEVAGIQDAGSEIAMYGPLRQFAENCLIPRVTYLGQSFTEKLAHRWDKRLRVWWDDPSPDDPEQKRADNEMLYNVQAKTPNEIRADYGLPPLPDGDRVNSPHPEPAQTNIHTGGGPGVAHAPPGAPPRPQGQGKPKPNGKPRRPVGNGRARP